MQIINLCRNATDGHAIFFSNKQLRLGMLKIRVTLLVEMIQPFQIQWRYPIFIVLVYFEGNLQKIHFILLGFNEADGDGGHDAFLFAGRCAIDG